MDWVDGEEFEAVFRWPVKDYDWQGSTAYHAIAMPDPPGSPDTPAGTRINTASSSPACGMRC